MEHLPSKVAIEFGELGTNNLKVVLLGKQGFSVKLSVHKNVLMENSNFFFISFLENGQVYLVLRLMTIRMLKFMLKLWD